MPFLKVGMGVCARILSMWIMRAPVIQIRLNSHSIFAEQTFKWKRRSLYVSAHYFHNVKFWRSHNSCVAAELRFVKVLKCHVWAPRNISAFLSFAFICCVLFRTSSTWPLAPQQFFESKYTVRRRITCTPKGLFSLCSSVEYPSENILTKHTRTIQYASLSKVEEQSCKKIRYCSRLLPRTQALTLLRVAFACARAGEKNGKFGGKRFFPAHAHAVATRNVTVFKKAPGYEVGRTWSLSDLRGGSIALRERMQALQKSSLIVKLE